MQISKWVAGPEFRGAGFVCSDGLEAVLHLSTKQAGMWQLSFFRDGEAVADAEFSVLAEALRSLVPGSWRLKDYPAPGQPGTKARSDAESFAAEQSEVRFHNADVSVRAGFVSQHGRVLASAVAADAISEERPRDAA